MTKQELFMLKKYCQSIKQKGYISDNDFFKLGYNSALDDVISFLNEMGVEE